MKSIYLAGPMTGLPDLNFPAFHAAAAKLRSAGHLVINPAEINSDQNANWADCMRADIPALLKCSCIALLPGWENSKGARLERHIAAELGMEVRLVSFFDAAESATAAMDDTAEWAATHQEVVCSK
jgi:hypothetical protein